MNKNDQIFFSELFAEHKKLKKNIYILQTHAGEVAMFARLVNEILKKEPEITIVASKPYHLDILKLFISNDVHIVYFNYLEKGLTHLQNDFYQLKTYHISVITSVDFWKPFWPDSSKIFFDELLKLLKLDRKHISFNPTQKSFDEENLLNKISKINLNLEKFIILTPEAASFIPLSEAFWMEICQLFYDNGYDIFLNTTNSSYTLPHTKKCILSFEEIYQLAKKSKGIIGLRSGLFDVVADIRNVPMYILYRTHIDNAIGNVGKNVLGRYSLKTFPYCNSDLIKEYECHYRSDDLIKDLEIDYKLKTKEQSKIDIVLSPDDNYVEHCLVSMISIMENKKITDEVTFYILNGGLQEYNKQLFRLFAQNYKIPVILVDINPEDFKEYQNERWGLAYAYRLKLPSLLPHVSKVIYLDCDTIVNSSLSSFFYSDLGENSLGMIPDMWYKKQGARFPQKTRPYCNSGVLLIDLDKWRKRNIERKLYESFLENKEIFDFPDQDILNTVLDNQIKIFDYKYNLQWHAYHEIEYAEEEAYLEALKNPIIIHYIFEKPWNNDCRHFFKNLYRKYYDVFLRMSGLSKVLDAAPYNIESFYQQFLKYSHVGEYNIILHRHLGDNFIIVSLIEEFEKEYKSKVHFVISPETEIVMKLFKIDNYTVVNMRQFIKDKLPLKEMSSMQIDKIEEELFAYYVPCIPVKTLPFIVWPTQNRLIKSQSFPNFLTSWSYSLGLNTIQTKLPTKYPAISQKFAKKIEEIAPLDKIVLFAPEAQSFKMLDERIWETLAKEIKSKGFEIISNVMQPENCIKGTHYLQMSLEEVIALAMHCHSVFSLRSGFCDVIATKGKNLYVFYTPEMGDMAYYSLNNLFKLPSPVHEHLLTSSQKKSLIWQGVDLLKNINRKWLTKYKKIPQATHKYYLFGLIPILKKKIWPNKVKYYLFGRVLLWKSVKKGLNKEKHYLFGVIPVLKIKR